MRVRASCVWAVLVVTAGVASGCGDARGPAGNDPAGAGMVAPPEGMRWQGTNGVVVAVPKGWETDPDPCGSAEGDAVRILAAGTPPAWCPGAGSAHDDSSMLIAPPDAPLPEIGRLRQRVDVHGVAVRHGGVRCRAGSSGPCTLAFAVPDTGVVVQVSYRGARPTEFVTAVRDSVTRVPDGYTTVPAIAYGSSVAGAKRTLDEAGLSGWSPDVDFPHYATGSRPEAGTVVALGTTVELTVGDG